MTFEFKQQKKNQSGGCDVTGSVHPNQLNRFKRWTNVLYFTPLNVVLSPARTHSDAHWLIHSKSCEIRCRRTDATQHTTLTDVQTAQSVQCTRTHTFAYTFSKHVIILFSHCAYPCIVQGKFKPLNSGSLGCYWSEENSRHMRYDENIHVPLINVHVHWYRLAGWLTASYMLSHTLEPMLNWNTLYVDAERMENAPFALNRIIAIVTVLRRRVWATLSNIHGEV